MRGRNGFSVIELLIVIGVILIITAVAIPSLIRSKISANEASASGTIRQISTAEMAYHMMYTAAGFAPDLPSLGGPDSGCIPDPAHACILDSVVSAGSKNGYRFFAAGFIGAVGSGNTTFVASSAPRVFNSTGVRLFCIATDDGVLRAMPGAPGAPPAPNVPTCVAYPIL
jgi:type IV pilus assembly protein PilA